jgi:hypothetical protein
VQSWGSGRSYFWHPYQNISDFTTGRSFIGFRFNTNSNSAATTGGGFLELFNTANTTQVVVPLNIFTANLNQYCEVMFDRVNKLIVVWLDGVQVSSTFFDFNSFVSADGKANLRWGCFNAGWSAPFTWKFRDAYFIDDTQDATQCNRLGPVDIRPAALASAVAPNWTSSDSATPLADLSTVLGTTTATQTLPTQTEPPSMDPVTLQFSASGAVASEPIVAFRADVSASRAAGYLFAPQATVKYNGTTVSGKQLIYPNGATMVYNQNAYLSEKAPDGSAWTPANIAATQLILTP